MRAYETSRGVHTVLGEFKTRKEAIDHIRMIAFQSPKRYPNVKRSDAFASYYVIEGKGNNVLFAGP